MGNTTNLQHESMAMGIAMPFLCCFWMTRR